MTVIISTHSFRGGTGKSNISANVAVQLARQGNRVGVFDTDIQSPGIHVILGLSESDTKSTLNNYLWGECSVEEATHQVYTDSVTGGSVWLVPSSIHPNDIARVLRERYDAGDMHAAFRELIASFDLDYLIIDTHPGLNEETLLSIAISDTLLIILRPDQQDFQGTSVTVDVARRLRVPNVQLIVNKVPPQYDFTSVRQQVTEAYEVEVSALLPLSVDVAQNASAAVFSLINPNHQFSDGIQQIVSQLVGEKQPETVSAR